MSDELEDGIISVSLKLKSMKVILHDRNDEGKDEFRCGELREMTGDERDGLFNTKAKKTKGSGKDFQVLDFRGLYSDLLKRCLFISPTVHETEDDCKAEFSSPDRPSLKLIDEKALLRYPVSTQKVLYENASKLNAMTEKEQKEEGEN